MNPEIRELKSHPDSRVEVIKRHPSGSLTCQFITDYRPYRAGDQVVVFPHETNLIRRTNAKEAKS